MIVQLGKFGDCINILPYAYMLHQRTGENQNWLIGKQWASILDGASYVNPVIWPGSDDTLPGAIANRPQPLRVTQAWMNPDRSRETDSFAKEQWRYVGALDERGKWPLVFDRRNPEREKRLIKTYIQPGKQNILIGTTSVSTPYRHATRLVNWMKSEFPDANIILLDNAWATQIYDLIGLFDAADLLITIDTCYLHLARAAQIPVIALVNDGWNGAVPPPQTIAAWRYAELRDDLSPVITAARNQLGKYKGVMKLAFICNSHDNSTPRHQRAMATHPHGMQYLKFDHRPTTKELFQRGLDTDADAIVFTNDDVTFPEGTIDKIKDHLVKFDFGCSRRRRDPVHCGREIFWFRSDWLRKNWEYLPEVYWSVQKPDLIICRWMRHMTGIPTTIENLNYDFPPVELPALVEHEDHKSNWDNHEVENSKEGLYNEHIWEKGV